jgi:hypothetical protein
MAAPTLASAVERSAGRCPDNGRMSQYFEIHPDNPQPRLLKQAAQILHQGMAKLRPPP